MAAPSYTEDLTDVTLAETTTGFSAYGGGASGLDQNADIAMQGSFCVGKQISNADKGQYFDNGSGITLGTGDHVFVWLFNGTPGLVDTLQNKGASIYLGTTSANYCQYHVEGNDTYGAAGRVAKVYPIDYSVRSNNTSPPYRSATGTPGANPQLFGGGLVTTATVKGFNCGIDAIRYGTGAYLTAGELIANGDASDNPCTFAGFQAQNDNISNRWGILTAVGGGYELQGMFAIGQNNAGTATKVNFKDSDRSIAIVDTPHAASTFTQFVIDHASSRVEWTNINITALGTTNPGLVSVTTNDPVFLVTGGTWTGLGTITFRSNTTVSGLTMRQTAQIAINGASLTDCIVDRNTASSNLVTADLELLDNVQFISDGTGHAVELTSIGSGSMQWTCPTSGYVTGATGSPVTPGSTGNETIYVNVGSGTLTINVSGNGTIPSIRSAGATVNVVANTAVTFTGMKDNSEVLVQKASDNSEIAHIENATAGTADNRSFTWNAAPGTVVNYKIHNFSSSAPDYETIYVKNYTVPSTDVSIQIQQRLDRNSI